MKENAKILNIKKHKFKNNNNKQIRYIYKLKNIIFYVC